MRLVLALLALCMAVPAGAERNFVRAPKKPVLSQEARRRVKLTRVQQPVIRRAPVRSKAIRAAAAARQRATLARRLKLSRTETERGFERYRRVRDRTASLARSPNVRVSKVGQVEGLAIERIDIISKKPKGPRPRILIFGGVHAGTEQVGVEAALRLAERAAKDPHLRDNFDITIVPLANPTGLVLGTRRNNQDVDVNRSFAQYSTLESRIVSKVFGGKVHAVLDLHGAGTKGRNGFFIIRGGEDGGMSKRILSAMSGASLLDQSGAGKTYRLDSLGSAESSNAGTLKGHAITRGVRYAYTFEAPTRLGPEKQVRGMMRLVRSALSNIRAHGEFERSD